MAVLLNQIEREWLSAKVPGTTANKPLNQLKREYYSSVIGGAGSGTKIPELERAWLAEYISNKGGTPTPGADIPTLWMDIVRQIGEIPSKYLKENKIRFYLNAAVNLSSFSPSASPSPSASISPSSSESPSLSPSASISP